MADKLRASGQIQDKDRYIPISKAKEQMMAMLEELKTEIEELPTNRMAITDSSGLICYGYSEYEPTAKDASKLIQQKITALRGNEQQ